jgi:lysophospholipid acyltransferase (LPLAT)-like uncharacterized protein
MGAGPISAAGAGVLAGLAATWRWDVRDDETFRAIESRAGAGGTGGIFAFWHNRILYAMLCPRFRRRGYAVIVSPSADGEVIARVAEKFGHRLPRGSTAAGGAAAMTEMGRIVQGGGLVGFTPDGPRGPRYVAQPGAVVLAQRTGVPIIPVAAAADRRWRARSWDAFEVPAPFARVAVVAGPFVEVGRTERVEEARRRLEDALRKATARAEGIFGRGLD